jgi:hypothetical protein
MQLVTKCHSIALREERSTVSSLTITSGHPVMRINMENAAVKNQMFPGLLDVS